MGVQIRFFKVFFFSRLKVARGPRFDKVVYMGRAFRGLR